MKKVLAGITGSLGAVASILALADALPQYNPIFLVLIGVTVGYALSSFAPNDTTERKMSERSKGIFLIIVMFVIPPFIIIFGIVVIWFIGFMTDSLIKYILGWSVVILLVSYITAWVVSCSWAEKSRLNHSTQNNSRHNNQSNSNTN